MRPHSLRPRFSNRRNRSRKPALRIDSLEAREVPATLELSNNVLTRTAGAVVNNSVSVTISGTDVVVADSSETIATSIAGATGSGSNSVTVPMSGVTGIVLNLGDGSDTIDATGVVVTTQNVAINNTGSLLTVAGPVRTTSGNISLAGDNQVTFTNAARVGGTVTASGTPPTATYTVANRTTGTISISANRDGAGAEGFDQGGGWIISGNNTAGAVGIAVNSGAGGTGNATLGLANVGTALGSVYAVAANGGNILWTSDAAVGGAQSTSYRGLANGGTQATAAIWGYGYNLTTSGAGGIGTDLRTVQTRAQAAGSPAALVAGNGGIYLVDWGSPLVLTGASATGPGNIRVVTANSGGHNLTVTGPVTTGSGSIYLAADDDFALTAPVGGSGFSGTVYLAGNRDLGNTANLRMNAGASITTSNSSANAVLLEAFNTNGTRAGGITLNNITVGDGGTVTAITSSLAASQGTIVAFDGNALVNTGPTGKVVLTTAPQEGATASIGTAALPIKVTAGTVVATSTTTSSTTGTTSGTHVTATGPAAFTATIGGTLANTGPIRLATESGPLTINGATSTSGGATVTLTGAGGVVLNAPVGSAGTGAIAINGDLSGAGNIVTGSGHLTVTQDGNSTYDGVATGSQGLVKTGAGNLTLSATQTLTGTTTVNGGTLTLGGNLAGGATVGSGGTLATGASTIAGPLAVSGTLAPGGTGTAVLGTGDLSFGTGGLFALNLNSPASPGGTYDQVSVTGAANLTNGNLRILVGVSPALNLNDSFTLVANDGADAVTGQFANGTEIAAFDNPRYRFTVGTAGGDGNDVALTLTTILPPRYLDMAGGVVTYLTGTLIDSSVSVSVTNGNYTLTDAAGVINLSPAAIAAGWSGDGTNSVTGPAAGVTALKLDLSDGNDTVIGLAGGSAPVTINAAAAVTTSGTLAPGGDLTFTNVPVLTLGGAVSPAGALTTTGIGTLNLTGMVSPGGTAALTAAGITAESSSLVSAGAIALTATHSVGTAAAQVRTQAGTLAVTGGAGGAFVREADGAALSASTTGAGDLSVVNEAGTLSIISPITTIGGNITLASADNLVLGANVTSGTGTIALTANTDGAGTEGFDQGTAVLTTGNTSGSAVTINVNTADGGTGSASVFGVSTAGTLAVSARGGSILYAGTTTLPNPVGGTAPAAAQLLRAGRYEFVVTGTGSIGTADRPLQSDNLSAANTARLTAGDGGIYWTDWGGTAFNMESAIATGPGNVQVVTANAGGHNLIVGPAGLTSPTTVVSTGSGSIFLAADDDFTLNANAIVGGAGFSGTVEMVMNRDAGNGQSLLMLAGSTITTANATADAVRLTGLSEAGSAGSAAAQTAGVGGGGISLSNITVGSGGTITVNTAGGTAGGRQGGLGPLPGTLLDAGPTGTVSLTARASDANGSSNATAGFGLGNIGIGGTTAAPTSLPVRVNAGTVTATTTGTTLGNTGSINIVGVNSTSFSATTAGRPAATVALATEPGVLTVAGPVTTDGGAVTLTATGAGGGVAINAQFPDSDTGPVTINAGTNPATLVTTLSLPGTQPLAVTAANGLEVTAAGTLAGTGPTGNATSVTGRTGGTVSPAGTGAGTLSIGNLALGAGSTLRADLNSISAFDRVAVTGSVDVSGATLNLLVNAPLATNDAFTILENDGADAITGQFAGGTTFRAANDPRYEFTLNYAGGDGNDIVATVTTVIAATLLDVSPAGVVTVSSADGLNNSLSVARSADTVTITDTAGVIELTAAATAAGWSGGGTNTVSGPAAGTSGFVFLTNTGTDAVTALNAGPVPVTISGTGSLAVNGLVTSDASVTVSGMTDITGAGTIQSPVVNLTASNGIGASSQRLTTTAGSITAAAGAGGLFLAETDGATLTATATGAGNVDVLNLLGTLTVAGTTSTQTGNVVLASADSIALAADVNAGSGTLTLAANTDGAGSEGYDQKAASISTTNATAGAVSITVNTPGGGTGNAILGQGSVGSNSGGGLKVTSNSGNILWSNDPVYAAFGASQTGLASGGSNAQTLKAYAYNFVTGPTGSVGTDARPLQLDNFGANGAANPDPNLTAAGGTGGVYATVWDANATDLTTGPLSALGVGNIRVVTANATGHNLWVNGPVSTGSGNIFLAADDNLDVGANVVIGGPGFSGTVWMQANRDQATAGQTFLMATSASIVTSNTTNVPTGPRTPATQAVYLDISGDSGTPSLLSVGSVTTGNGGRIVLNAIPNGIGAEAGRVALADAANLLDAGLAGTVELVSGITATATADAVGSSSTPVRVAGGDVLVTSTFGNVFITGTGATDFTVTDGVLASQMGAGPTVGLKTTAGALTIDTLNTAAGGPITLDGAGGVVLNAPIGGSTAGAIGITGTLSGAGNITLGTGGLTLTQDGNSTFDGTISGPQGLTKTGTGTLTLTAANTYTGATTVSAGTLLVANSTGSGTGTGNLSVADRASFGGAGAVSGAVAVDGTLTTTGPLAIGGLTFGTTGARILAVQLNSSLAGLAVTGAADLTGASLATTFAAGFPPLLGDVFTIVGNDGTDPVDDTLAGLAEGATFTIGNRTFRINYGGGSGNDVTLTVTAIAAGPPVNVVPGGQTTVEDHAIVFLAATGNALTVESPEFGGPHRVTLTATGGVLTLSGIAGLTFTDGDGTADATMTFSGPLPAVRAALDGLTFTPIPNVSGPASVTIASDDLNGTGTGVQSDTDSVSITVVPVNDPPSFVSGGDRTVGEDTGPQTIPSWATAISAGAADESGQVLSFQVTTDNDSLFSVLPAVSPAGTLTFTPATDGFGTATVTVILTDDGGTANGGQNASLPQTFTITVDPGNEAHTSEQEGDRTLGGHARQQERDGRASAMSGA